MAFGQFFTRYGTQTRPSKATDFSREEKEHFANVRSAIFSALNDGEQTRSDKVNTTALTDVQHLGMLPDFTASTNILSKYIYSVDRDKRPRIETYREMAKYPEISFAVDEYVDEAINEDKDGNFIGLIIKNQEIEKNENSRKTILAEFEYMCDHILNIQKFIDQWFREFMIDGEIFFEKVIDNQDEEKGIIRVKKLMTTRCNPIWKDIESDEILFFAYQDDENQLLNLPTEMIAYANSGLYEYSRDESMKIVNSFLEECKTTYKRLKLLEDALVIYRIVRAPERRVFKIDVGNLPKGRAEQFMNEMITRYRQKKFFNTETGDISEALDSMAMTEDYWFPVFQGGRSSDVTSLPGGSGLGEIEDVEYFRNKLYQGLKIPRSRYGEENRFSIGNTDDITREEQKFVKAVKRFTRRFSECILSIFMTHLSLKGITDEYGLTDQDIAIHLLSNNLFERFMEAKILELQFQNFGYFADLIDTEKPLFSREWVAKKYLEIDEEAWQENIKMLVQEEQEGGGGDEEDDGGEEADLGL